VRGEHTLASCRERTPANTWNGYRVYTLKSPRSIGRRNTGECKRALAGRDPPDPPGGTGLPGPTRPHTRHSARRGNRQNVSSSVPEPKDVRSQARGGSALNVRARAAYHSRPRGRPLSARDDRASSHGVWRMVAGFLAQRRYARTSRASQFACTGGRRLASDG